MRFQYPLPSLLAGPGSCADAHSSFSSWLGIVSNANKLLEAPADKAFSISSSGSQNENENQADEGTNAVTPPAAEEVPVAA